MRRATPAILMSIALLGLPGVSARAQTVRAGSGSVSTTVTVGLVIPAAIKVRRYYEAQVIAVRGDTTFVFLPVEVAANQEWSLRMQPHDGQWHDVLGQIRVRNYLGDWQPINQSMTGITVVEDHGACNYTPFSIEFALIGTRAVNALGELVLELAPARR